MYLKHNVKLSPYIWNWYAWSHLIPPHAAAANIVGRHIKIMESFVEYPQMHFEAIHTKGMIGGPFINLSPAQQPKILELLQETKHICKDLVALDADIKKFDLFLQENAKGDSCELLYNDLPESLKGMVELTYSINNAPNMNFIEPIVYKQHYNEAHQFFTLSQVVDDNRPFSLSTPHISSQDTIELHIPFSSPMIDSLMRMKTVSADPDDLIDALKIKPDHINLYRELFTEAAPNKENFEFGNRGVRIRYFGHACVLLQTKDMSILVDPVLGYNFDGKQTDRFAYTDLPEEIDYVLITHNHQDHFLFEVLLQLRYKIKNIVVPASNSVSIADPSMKLILRKLGFSNIHEIGQFDEISLGGFGKVTALPFLGEHGDLDIRSKLAYHISLYDLSFLFLADSNNLINKLYDYIFSDIGSVDMLFIGMECVGAPISWLYGPMFSTPLNRKSDLSRRLDGSNYLKALEIIKKSHCKEVSVYAMGMEPWLSYIMAVDYKADSIPIIESNKLIHKCHEQGIQAQRLFGKKEWIFPDGIYRVHLIETGETCGVL